MYHVLGAINCRQGRDTSVPTGVPYQQNLLRAKVVKVVVELYYSSLCQRFDEPYSLNYANHTDMCYRRSRRRSECSERLLLLVRPATYIKE